MAAYPKPTNEKVNRNKPAFDWTELPEVSTVPIPDIPFADDYQYHASTLGWWLELWRRPQATAWEFEASFFFRFATLMDKMIRNGGISAVEMTEMRQIEDRLGLNPKALLQLRWRIRKESKEVNPLAVVVNMEKPKRFDPREA